MTTEEEITVGSLIRAKAKYYSQDTPPELTGVVTEVKEKTELFSEKYAITEIVTYVDLLCSDGQMAYIDSEDYTMEVISEAG